MNAKRLDCGRLQRRFPGSARAPRAVFRALAENFGGARVLPTALKLTRARANREGAVGGTRGACAPRAMPVPTSEFGLKLELEGYVSCNYQ